MTCRTAIFPVLACAFALASAPAGAGAGSGAGAAPGMERLSSDDIGELKELLVAHGIPPARQLAGEITREVTGNNSEAATAVMFRPPVPHTAGDVPARAAAAHAGEPTAAGRARASAPPENRSPLGNLLRKVLRFLNFSN